jgi:hypothetical protein
MAVETLMVLKPTVVQFNANSMWSLVGTPGPGVAPTATIVQPDNTTDGSLKQANPAAGKQKWLVLFAGDMPCSTGGAITTLYDRLLHVGAILANTTAVQNVNTGSPTPTLNRYADGLGNSIFLECTTAMSAVATTVTVIYTNELGVAGRTATASAAAIAWVVGATVQLTLQQGDYGVQSVTSAQFGTVHASGAWALVIAHPLARLVALLNTQDDLWSPLLDGEVEIKNNAALALVLEFSNASGASSYPLANYLLQFVDR